MNAVKHVVVMFTFLFAVNAFATQSEENRHIWVGVEVGSPFYNMIMEADEREGAELYGHQPFLLGIRRAETVLDLRNGDYFEVNIDTGELREVRHLTPDMVGEFRETGLFLIDVVKDTAVVLPLDIIKDLQLVFSPSETSEDRNLSHLDLLANQFQSIAADLRTALGLSNEGQLGQSGITHIVVSSMDLSPSGILEGAWDVVVGLFSAGEDLGFTPLKIGRRSIMSLIDTVRNLFGW